MAKQFMNWSKVRVFPHCEGIPTANMTRRQWEIARGKASLNAIGGSEIGTLMPGADTRFSSPIRMFYQRIGLWDNIWKDNKYAFMGRLVEQQIIYLWQHWQGSWDETMAAVELRNKSRKSQHCHYIIRNPKYPNLLANIDNRIIHSPDAPNKRGILECKTISGHAADRYELGIPPKYIAQMQQYMLITETDYAELAVLKDGVDFQVYPLIASDRIQAKILEVSEDFFSRVRGANVILSHLQGADFDEKVAAIQHLEPPVVDGNDEYDFLSEKAKLKVSSQILEPNQEIIDLWTKTITAKKEAKAAAALGKSLSAQIRQHMIQENIYKYSWEDGLISNGQKLLIQER